MILLDEYEDDKQSQFTEDLKPVTKTITKGFEMKRNYNKISNELRLKLIEDVYKKSQKIKLAARRLGINYSSAKAICQIYKRECRIDKKLPKRIAYTEKYQELKKNASQFVSLESRETSESSVSSNFQEICPEISQPLYIKPVHNFLANFQSRLSQPTFVPYYTQTCAPTNVLPQILILTPEMTEYGPIFTDNLNLGSQTSSNCSYTVPVKPPSFSYPSQPIYLNPHDSNIINSRINGGQALINPVFYMPTQNINMTLTSFPQINGI